MQKKKIDNMMTFKNLKIGKIKSWLIFCKQKNGQPVTKTSILVLNINGLKVNVKRKEAE